jgi:uncharacterized protein YaaN involved in tellurite resistance
MIDEIELQNTIDDLKRDNSFLEDEIEDLTRDLQKFEAKERVGGFMVDYIKDRKEHAEAMGDKKAVEIYKEILKKA